MNGASHQNLSIHDVNLDVTNPRIQRMIAMYKDTPSDDQIGLALGAGSEVGVSGGTTYSSLRAAIKTAGGLIQAIIVNKLPDNSYVVIEGNTRLFIYKRFHEEGIDGNWELIPSVVHENLKQDDIEAIRLQAHLVGPRDWDPYSKAKYLHLLHNIQNMPLSFLVDYCGGRQREVERYIQAYSDMENFYRPLVGDEDFDPTRFSAFVELQKPSVINELVNRGKGQHEFSGWVAGQKFNRLEDVRQLPRILSNPHAFEIFEDQGSRAALKYLENLGGPTDLDGATFESLAKALAQKIRELNWQDVVQMKNSSDDPKTESLIDVYGEVKVLIEQIEYDG
jgi:hypothetical protein